MSYNEYIKMSWYLNDLTDIVKTMDALDSLPSGLDGEFAFYDSNGDQIATFWFNGEADEWMFLPTLRRS